MADPRPDELGVSSCIKSILEGADVTHPIPVEDEVLKVNSSHMENEHFSMAPQQLQAVRGERRPTTSYSGPVTIQALFLTT